MRKLLEIMQDDSLLEMPHLDTSEFGLMDLNIEKYNVSNEEKKKFVNAYNKNNLYAYHTPGKIWYWFNGGNIKKVNKPPKNAIILPNNWYKIATNFK